MKKMKRFTGLLVTAALIFGLLIACDNDSGTKEIEDISRPSLSGTSWFGDANYSYKIDFVPFALSKAVLPVEKNDTYTFTITDIPNKIAFTNKGKVLKVEGNGYLLEPDGITDTDTSKLFDIRYSGSTISSITGNGSFKANITGKEPLTINDQKISNINNSLSDQLAVLKKNNKAEWADYNKFNKILEEQTPDSDATIAEINAFNKVVSDFYDLVVTKIRKENFGLYINPDYRPIKSYDYDGVPNNSGHMYLLSANKTAVNSPYLTGYPEGWNSNISLTGISCPSVLTLTYTFGDGKLNDPFKTLNFTLHLNSTAQINVTNNSNYTIAIIDPKGAGSNGNGILVNKETKSAIVEPTIIIMVVKLKADLSGNYEEDTTNNDKIKIAINDIKLETMNSDTTITGWTVGTATLPTTTSTMFTKDLTSMKHNIVITNKTN